MQPEEVNWPNRVFVSARFEGDKEVFPGSQIIEEPIINDRSFESLRCAECGNISLFWVRCYTGKARVRFSGEQIYFETEDPIFRQHQTMSLYGDGDWEYDEDTFLGRAQQYAYRDLDIFCGYCDGMASTEEGVIMYHAETCPGCHVCERKVEPKEARLDCATVAFQGHCTPGQDCGQCNFNYSRVRNGVTIKEIEDAVEYLWQD